MRYTKIDQEAREIREVRLEKERERQRRVISANMAAQLRRDAERCRREFAEMARSAPSLEVE